MNKYQTFESYLQEIHAEDYHGLDDDMPDAFDAWVSDLDVAMVMDYAEKWNGEEVQKAYGKGYAKGVEDANNVYNKVHESIFGNPDKSKDLIK